MFSRRVLTALLLTLPLVASAAPGLVRVWPSYRTAESFKRVSEYIDGVENTGNDAVLRSQSDVRDGYYFLVRTRTDTAVAGAKISVEVALPQRSGAKTFVFPADLPAGDKVFHLGITGADWPDAKVRPGAWRVVLRSADGTILATRHSFLWSSADAR